MNFSDKWATNEEGEKFIFTVEMQRKLHSAGLPLTAEALAEYRSKYVPPAAPDPNRRDERRESAPKPARVEIAEAEIDPATGKFIGILKTYNTQKGFGFIGRGGDDDIYFNKKKTLDDPSFMTIGGKVLFTVSSYRGKEEAADVEEYEEWG